MTMSRRMMIGGTVACVASVPCCAQPHGTVYLKAACLNGGKLVALVSMPRTDPETIEAFGPDMYGFEYVQPGPSHDLLRYLPSHVDTSNQFALYGAVTDPGLVLWRHAA